MKSTDDFLEPSLNPLRVYMMGFVKTSLLEMKLKVPIVYLKSPVSNFRGWVQAVKLN